MSPTSLFFLSTTGSFSILWACNISSAFFKLVPSVVVTTQGSNYDEGDVIQILGSSAVGGTTEDITLGISDLETTYTKQRLDLTHIFLEAEDDDDTNGLLQFKIWNTLTYDLVYKNSLLIRIFDDL